MTTPVSTPVTGRTTGMRLRNGELRAMVARVLADQAGTGLTPGVIARTLNRSAGAVGNALKVLADRGHAETVSHAPLTYQATPTTASMAATTVVRGVSTSRP